jgi:hypothetical protein
MGGQLSKIKGLGSLSAISLPSDLIGESYNEMTSEISVGV